MSNNIEALRAEQLAVQANKRCTRTLTDYGTALWLPGDSSFCQSRVSEVSSFLAGEYALKSQVSFRSLLKSVARIAAKGSTVHWADMGCGFGVAQRTHANTVAGNNFAYTSVDILPYDLGRAEEKHIKLIKKTAPRALCPTEKVTRLLADVHTVQLPEPADIITFVQSIQYLANPLQAIAQSYNQLKPNGLLAIATGHTWSSNIVYGSGGANQPQVTPTQSFIQELADKNIAYGIASRWAARENEPPFRENARTIQSLVIRKLAGTALEATMPVVEVSDACDFPGYDGYKRAAYQYSSDVPVVKVVQV